MKITLKPIGVIHSPFIEKNKTPIQPFKSNKKGKVELFKEYSEGLENLKEFSHIILIYYFHKSKGYNLKVKPFMDQTKKGLFATRAPKRPNQLGISVVKLVDINGNILTVEGIDCLDGTPLLDIKPYVPEFNNAKNTKIGWLEEKVRTND